MSSATKNVAATIGESKYAWAQALRATTPGPLREALIAHGRARGWTLPVGIAGGGRPVDQLADWFPAGHPLAIMPEWLPSESQRRSFLLSHRRAPLATPLHASEPPAPTDTSPIARR